MAGACRGVPAGGDWLLGSLAYNLVGTAVTFPVEPGAAALHPPGYAFPDDAAVTVRITHLAPCVVPVARLLICDSYREIALGFPIPNGRSDLLQLLNSRKRLRGKPGLDELQVGTTKPGAVRLLLVSSARFRVLQAESTLPLMSAPYLFRSRHEREQDLDAGEGEKKR